MTPDYINRCWTEELLALMFRKRNARVARHNRALKGEPEPDSAKFKRVTDEELFLNMGVTPIKMRPN